MTARLPLVVGSGNDNAELVDNLAVPKRLARDGKVSLALAADSNNVAPAGINSASTLLVTCTNAGAKITGLAAGDVGDEVTIRAEYDSLAFVLTARDSASTSTNWFSLARDLTLQPYQSVTFRYQMVASGTAAWVPIDDRYGTAAPRNVPASGNAASNEVVLGSDTRLGADPITGTFLGNGASLSGTVIGQPFKIPYAFTIVSWAIAGDGSVGSGTIDVQVSADNHSWSSITAAAIPAVSSDYEHASSTLTAWTTAFPSPPYFMRFVGSGWAGWDSASIALVVSK